MGAARDGSFTTKHILKITRMSPTAGVARQRRFRLWSNLTRTGAIAGKVPRFEIKHCVWIGR